MSSKVANLIALELGILIAILTWRTFLDFGDVKSPPVIKRAERTANAFATVAPVRKSKNQLPAAVDYRADAAPEQGEQQDQRAQEYDQVVAPEVYPSPALEDGFVTEASPYYTDTGIAPYYAEVAPEPFIYSPGYLATPIDRFFSQSSVIVVYSNSRSCGRRPRSMRPVDCPAPTPAQAPTRIAAQPPHTVPPPPRTTAPPPRTVAPPPRRAAQPPSRGGTMAPRRNVLVQSSRPNPRISSRQIP